MSTRRSMPPRQALFWRVFWTNVAVLTAACAITVLVLSPGVISSGVALAELAVFTGAIGAMLMLNLALARRAFAPLRHLTSFARNVDPLMPGARADAGGAPSEAAELAAAFNEMLDRLDDERRESDRRALAAQESERLRIAQELHDEVGQTLTAVLLQLARAAKRAAGELPGRAWTTRRRPRARASRTSAGSRCSCGPRRSTTSGSPSALRGARASASRERPRSAHRRAQSTEPLPALTAGGRARRLPRRPGGADQRRAPRRAPPAPSITLEPRDGRLRRCASRDDGRGIARAAAEGGGIRGMRERAALDRRAAATSTERPAGRHGGPARRSR